MMITRATMAGDTKRQLLDIVIDGDVITQVAPSGSLPTEGHEIVDADGRVVMPGLWDEHVHFGLWAQHRRRIDLSAATSAKQAGEIMAAALALRTESLVPGEVVVAAGYRDGLWPDQKTTALLDSYTGDTPVLLLSVDVHSCWVNSATLGMFGVTGHDDYGVLEEQECFTLTGAVSNVPSDVLDQWTLEAAHAAAARGVVGIVDLDMAYNSVEWVRRAAALEGNYPLLVEAGVYPDHLERAIADGLHTGLALAPGISVGPFKIITDGSLNTRTAHCVEPYLGVSGEVRGGMNFGLDEIERVLLRAHNSGFGLAVHAIGDEANRLILDVMEKHQLPGRIEHAQLVLEDDFARFARMGIIASVQPEHAVDDRDVTDVYWADRSSRAFALRTMLDHGVRLIFGSDAPVAPLDPWVAIAAAVTRTRDGREAWHPEQSLSLDGALRASTRSSIEPGQPADIVLLDADPYWLVEACGSDVAKASDALRAMPVWMTLRRGEITHSQA